LLLIFFTDFLNFPFLLYFKVFNLRPHILDVILEPLYMLPEPVLILVALFQEALELRDPIEELLVLHHFLPHVVK
jgi:hypothetical protein